MCLVYCLDAIESSLNVSIEQEKKLKPLIKNVSHELSFQGCLAYEISFIPELEGQCGIEIEQVDAVSEQVVNGDMFNLLVKAVDFKLMPFPLAPFAINKLAKFNVKCLWDDLSEFSVQIKSSSNKPIEHKVTQLDANLYEIAFVPTLVERHILEIYFDNKLVNDGG